MKTERGHQTPGIMIQATVKQTKFVTYAVIGITGISGNAEMERYDSRYRKEITILTEANDNMTM